jgi:hypothetical protein
MLLTEILKIALPCLALQQQQQQQQQETKYR